MPTYDYACPHCGEFSHLRSIAARNDPAACPQCGSPAARVLQAPQLTTLSASTRSAHATNERASHEPRHSSGHVHGPGCGCGSGKKGATVQAGDGAKLFPNKRPWMISH